MTPQVSAVVVSFNTRDEVLRCLAALQGGGGPILETILVDNASGDGTPDAVRSAFPHVRLQANDLNVGFARAMNQGLRAAAGAYVLVLNSDAEVKKGAVAALANVLDARQDVAIVGPRTVGSDGGPQLSFGPALTLRAEIAQRRLVRGLVEGRPGAREEVAALAAREHEPDWVSGSCFLARRERLAEVGFFDEGFFLYEEDVDLCLRVRQRGGRVLFTPEAEVVHHLGRSMARAPERARLEYHRSHLLYYRKHHGAPARAALRAWMAAAATLRWLRAARPGGARERALEARILGMALFG